jgi:AcrR family transcriptional regulator
MAEHLGVSKTAPYRHFATKQDLLIALAAEGYQRFADMLEDLETQIIGSSPKELMNLMYSRYGEFAQTQPELYRLMFSRLGNSLHSERCRLNAQRAFQVLIRLVQIVEPETPDPRALSLSLFSSLHGWVMILMDDLIPPEGGAHWESWLEFVRPPQTTSR